ncbi:MAG: Flp pilus assembly protein CpaB [Planctomycetota bacterium]|jgi:pilus assembly protein CpaB
MKWSIIGLVIAGVTASLFAAVLVGALRAENRSTGEAWAVREVTVVTAAKNLPAMSVVKGDDVTEKTVLLDQAPEGSLFDPVQVVGKVLVVPMVAGQSFTSRCFASEGTGVHLASALPEGMRAISVSLSNHGGLRGIIYPGSVVDVLVSLRVPLREGTGHEVISVTLLQGVHVLAVENRTVTRENAQGDTNLSDGMRRLMVTLMLDSARAEALQLAMQYGTISLALRNPLDMSLVTKAPTPLSELSRNWVSPMSNLVEGRPEMPEADDSPPVDEAQLVLPKPATKWEIVVIRGATRQKYSFSIPMDQWIRTSDEQSKEPVAPAALVRGSPIAQ